MNIMKGNVLFDMHRLYGISILLASIVNISCASSYIPDLATIESVCSLMNEFVSTFNESDELIDSSKMMTTLHGGVFYGQYSLMKEAAKIKFSDGCNCDSEYALLISASEYEDSFFSGKRIVAGVTPSGSVKNVYGFNAYVPGTCMVIASSEDENVSLNLHSQKKGCHADYIHDSITLALTTKPQEVKLHCDDMGSFWITSDGTSKIHAVRFVPDFTIPLIRERQVATEIFRNSRGNLLVDFGKDAFGQIEIVLESINENDSVIVCLGEEIHGDSVTPPYSGSSKRFQEIIFPIKKGKQTYRPLIERTQYSNGLSSLYMPADIGEVMPFRFAEIKGYTDNLTNDDVIRLACFHKFNEDASGFHSDNETLNQVWELCKYSMKATSFMGYYIDGDRERCPYEADALVNQLSHFACDNDYSMSKRTIEYLLKNPTWPTEWLMQTIMLIWNHYLFTGDDSIIKNHIELIEHHTMMPFVDASTGLVSTSDIAKDDIRLWNLNRNGIIQDIVDWPQKDDDPTFNFDFTKFNAVVNAYHYYVCKIMAEMYGVIGEIAKEYELHKYADEFYKTYQHHFFDYSTGLYRDGIESATENHSFYANMYALCFGLVPDEYVNPITNYVISKGMACSVFGSMFLLETLYKNGKGDYALSLMTSDDQRSWMNMIENGSTITTEAWDDKVKPNQDWNHAWGASPAYIIQSWLMGIRPTSPGFKTAVIQPQIGNLKYAKCRMPTKHGPIEVQINRDDSYFNINVNIPNSIITDIVIPFSSENDSLLVDGAVCTNYERVNDGVLLSGINGSHQIRLSNGVNMVKENNNLDNSPSAYELNGNKINGTPNGKIIIKGGNKLIIK